MYSLSFSSIYPSNFNSNLFIDDYVLDNPIFSSISHRHLLLEYHALAPPHHRLLYTTSLLNLNLKQLIDLEVIYHHSIFLLLYKHYRSMIRMHHPLHLVSHCQDHL